MKAKRYFLVEQPANSEMWELGCFKRLWSLGNLGSVTFPQCAVGLKSPEGLPLLKVTDLLSNAMEILQQFDGLKCSCEVHGTITGGVAGERRSKLSQIWPLEMCRRIVAGICKLADKECTSAFPYGEDPAIVYDCKACVQRLSSQHPSHSRKREPPKLCRHPDVASVGENCKGCF